MQGKLFGLVPYDLRLPTPERLRQKVWDPESDEIISPAVFGVGWTLNLAALKRRYPIAFWLLMGAVVAWAVRKMTR
jgi:hypothetical protein